MTLFREITKVTARFSENYTKSINILSEKIAEILRHVRKIAKKWLLVSSGLSINLFVRMEQLGTKWTVFREAWLLKTFLTISGTLHDHICTFMTVSRLILLRMRSFSNKSCRGNQYTHFVFKNFYFSTSRTAYNVVWKCVVEADRTQTTAKYGACAFHSR